MELTSGLWKNALQHLKHVSKCLSWQEPGWVLLADFAVLYYTHCMYVLAIHIQSVCVAFSLYFSSAPGPVTGLQAFYPVLVWQEPAEPSGVVLDYQLTFTRGGQSRTRSTTLPHYVIDESHDVPGNSGSFNVEVISHDQYRL